MGAASYGRCQGKLENVAGNLQAHCKIDRGIIAIDPAMLAVNCVVLSLGRLYAHLRYRHYVTGNAGVCRQLGAVPVSFITR